MSTAIPFVQCPAALQNLTPSLDVANVGFDPLGFSSTLEDVQKYREAELKHSRLAMLAAIGWPVSELYDGAIASNYDLPVTTLLDDGRAPALLNGNLSTVSPYYWGFVIGLAAAIDIYGITQRRWWTPSIDEDVPPVGGIQFDPFGLYSPYTAAAEIKHGRVAMLAVSIFALQEYVTQQPIVAALL